MRRRGGVVILWLLFWGGLCLPALSWGEALALHGTVRDADGKPVAGAEVALYEGKNVKKPADFVSRRTEADGRYTVSAPAGQYFALAVLRKGDKRFGPLDLGDKHSGEAVTVELKAGSDPQRDFTVMDLREAARQHQKKNADLARLSGRILGKNGQPLAMAAAVADTVAKVKELPTYISAWSDSSGGYVLLLPPGRYSLGVVTEFPPPPGLALTQEVTVSGDREGLDLATEVESQASPPLSTEDTERDGT